MAESIKEQLEDHLEKGKPWERMETPILGLYVVKAPATKNTPPRLFLELNPEGKWKGFFINNEENLSEVCEILTNDITHHLIHEIASINPEINKHGPKKLKME